jgi:hypothetical protein
MIAQVFKNFPAFYGNVGLLFITVFTRVRHWMLFRGRGITVLARELAQSRLHLELLGVSGEKDTSEGEKDLLTLGRK